MAHFAKVEKGIVVQVIVAEQSHIDTLDGDWVQTSYNTFGGKTNSIVSEPLRKNFAGIGMIYDKDRDAFYDPQPFKSWTLNEDTCLWEPPVKYPDDDTKQYQWDEDTKSWK
tara:strand:+ start:139 stop:471 length:333 start_codon:yes stop_codon:yes gene_type:complete